MELTKKLLWKQALRRSFQFMELLQLSLISISDALTMSNKHIKEVNRIEGTVTKADVIVRELLGSLMCTRAVRNL